MSGWAEVRNDFWNLGQLLGMIYFVIPLGFLLIIFFYKWIARVFICPMFFFFGSKSPRKLYWKIYKSIVIYILKPIFILFAVPFSIVTSIAYLACICCLLFFSVCVVVGYFFFLWTEPLYVVPITLLIIYFKFLLPRYNERFTPKKVNEQGV